MLSYVEQAVNDALGVVKYNPESPDYRPAEDPFPPPDDEETVVRYDLVRPPLPQRSQGGANQAVPDANNFCKLSVYVRNGVVVQVLEDIDVVSRLKDLARIYGTELPKDKSPRELAAVVVDVINVLRRGQGNEPIQMRTMSLQIGGAGTAQRAVPPTGSVRAELPASGRSA